MQPSIYIILELLWLHLFSSIYGFSVKDGRFLSISHFDWMLTENAKSTPRLDDRVKQSSYSKPVIWRWRHLQVICPHHIPVASYMYPGSSPGTRLTFLHFLTRLYVLRGTCLFVCFFQKPVAIVIMTWSDDTNNAIFQIYIIPLQLLVSTRPL